MSLSPRFNLLSVRWLYHEIIIAFYNPESGGKKRRGPRLCVVWLFFRLTAPLRYASTFIYLLFRSVIGRSGQQGAVWTHRTICPTLHNRHLIAYPIYSMLRCIKHIVGYTFRTLFVVFFLYEGSTVYKSFLLSNKLFWDQRKRCCTFCSVTTRWRYFANGKGLTKGAKLHHRFRLPSASSYYS